MKKSILFLAALCIATAASAQFRRTPTPNDTLQSVRVNGDKVTFSIYAPNAETVTMSGDINARGVQFVKAENGVWSATLTNVVPGNYRYSFVVDGVNTFDPKGGEIQGETRAVAKVQPTGNEFFAMKNVPHGAIAQRYYFSKTLNQMRRMHVWTPAGYEKSADKLPVLYLVHGGGDTDNSWPGVGAAGFILDNLLAEGKIVPMVVVMPNGSIDTPSGNVHDEVPIFADDMITSIMPYVEENYRVLTDPDHTAMAGLSMGGMETMETVTYHPERFKYMIVLSSSYAPGNTEKYEMERAHLKQLTQQLNNYKIVLFTQGGPEDIAYNNCKETLKLYDEAGIKYEFTEAPGGHSWHTWRNNLHDFAPRLFK